MRPSVADGGTPLKDPRCPQFAAQIGSPTARFAALIASLTAAPLPATRYQSLTSFTIV